MKKLLYCLPLLFLFVAIIWLDREQNSVTTSTDVETGKVTHLNKDTLSARHQHDWDNYGQPKK